MHSILQTNIGVRIYLLWDSTINMYLRIIPTYQPSVNPRNGSKGITMGVKRVDFPLCALERHVVSKIPQG